MYFCLFICTAVYYFMLICRLFYFSSYPFKGCALDFCLAASGTWCQNKCAFNPRDIVFISAQYPGSLAGLNSCLKSVLNFVVIQRTDTHLRTKWRDCLRSSDRNVLCGNVSLSLSLSLSPLSLSLSLPLPSLFSLSSLSRSLSLSSLSLASLSVSLFSLSSSLSFSLSLSRLSRSLSLSSVSLSAAPSLSLSLSLSLCVRACRCFQQSLEQTVRWVLSLGGAVIVGMWASWLWGQTD